VWGKRAPRIGRRRLLPGAEPGRARRRCPRRGRACRTQGTALRLPHRRNQLRPGADHRPVFAHRGRGHLRSAAGIRIPGQARAHAPNTAAAMPEVSATSRPSPSASSPASTLPTTRPSRAPSASWWPHDYVYSLKRHYDPRWKSGNLYILENAKILGLNELRKKLMDEKKPFDYDAPVEGLRALDRYTFQVRLGVATPRFLYNFSDGSFTAARGARGGRVLRRQDRRTPGGHRALRLKAWKRSSRIVLARNPNYREVLLRRAPAAGTPGCRRGRALQGRACRCWTKCTSPSSKNSSRAG
jgi:hypothetical protein